MAQLKDLIFANTHNYKGHLEHQFADLAKLFSRLQDARAHQGGAALTVYLQNQKVLDIYTGKKSAHEDWQENTLSVCYSTGKGVLATLAHILVSEGKIQYDTPVASYWPEFGQNSKAHITLADILCHHSGLYDIRNNITSAQEMVDWPHMLKVMAQATPRFQPGQEYAYQALTYGWLVGGCLEKATGQSLQALLQQYLVEPLQLDGAYFGVPVQQLSRVAKPLDYTAATAVSAESATQSKPANKDKSKRGLSLSDKIVQFSGQDPQDFLDAMVPKGMKGFSFFDDATLQQPIPAANGVFSSRSLAKIYAMLANAGRWQGKCLIDPHVFQQLSQIQSYKRDRVMPIPMQWRLGYHRILTLGKQAEHGFGHIGYNGSGAWCDPQRQLSFAYTHNYPVGSITGDYRLWAMSQEAIRCADYILKGTKGWF